MKSRSRILLGLLAVFAFAAGAVADSKPDLTQRFLLLATTKTSTMQKELNEGFGVTLRGRLGCRQHYLNLDSTAKREFTKGV